MHYLHALYKTYAGYDLEGLVLGRAPLEAIADASLTLRFELLAGCLAFDKGLHPLVWRKRGH